MKRVLALLLVFVMAVLCVTVNVGGLSGYINPYEQDLIFYDTLGYEVPVIRYHTEASEDWQSEPLVYMGQNKAGEDMYYFNFPADEKYTFYIEGKDRRTQERTYTGRDITVRCYKGYVDKDGYDMPEARIAPGGISDEHSVIFSPKLDFGEPTIYYRALGSDPDTGWQSADMSYYKTEYNTVYYRYELPRDIYCFYITDGNYRTVDIWSSQSVSVSMPIYGNSLKNGSFRYIEDKGGYEVECRALEIARDEQYLVHPVGTGEQRYRERLDAYLQNPDMVYYYAELYYHQDSSGETDWALINANCGVPDWHEAFAVIGNRAFRMGTLEVFRFGMAVYDVKEDTFYDLYTLRDSDRYNGLMRAVNSCGAGKLIGDMDKDDELTVIDATLMQRCEVKLCDYPVDDIAEMEGLPLRYYTQTYSDSYPYYQVYDEITYFSDFDRNGERDIVDATRLQRYVTYID